MCATLSSLIRVILLFFITSRRRHLIQLRAFLLLRRRGARTFCFLLIRDGKSEASSTSISLGRKLSFSVTLGKAPALSSKSSILTSTAPLAKHQPRLSCALDCGNPFDIKRSLASEQNDAWPFQLQHPQGCSAVLCPVEALLHRSLWCDYWLLKTSVIFGKRLTRRHILDELMLEWQVICIGVKHCWRIYTIGNIEYIGCRLFLFHRIFNLDDLPYHLTAIEDVVQQLLGLPATLVWLIALKKVDEHCLSNSHSSWWAHTEDLKPLTQHIPVTSKSHVEFKSRRNLFHLRRETKVLNYTTIDPKQVHNKESFPSPLFPN